MLKRISIPDTFTLRFCGGVIIEYPSFLTVTLYSPVTKCRGLYPDGVIFFVSWSSINILAPDGFESMRMDRQPATSTQHNIANTTATRWFDFIITISILWPRTPKSAARLFASAAFFGYVCHLCFSLNFISTTIYYLNIQQ